MIKVGLIGTGSRGVSLAGQINKIKKSKIIALADVNSVRLNEAASDLGVSEKNCFQDYNDLLDIEEIDGVIIATPDYQHFEPAVAAIAAGKHVYCEKAMTARISKSTELVEKAKNNDQVFYVGHNVRFMSAANKLHQLITDGELGRVQMVWARRFVQGAKYWHRWHRYQDKSGGLLVHKGAHFLDQLNWNSGSRPAAVTAFGGLDVFQGKEDAPRRCKDCDITDECPYNWNIEEGKPRRYYLQAEKEDGYIWDTCIYYPGSDVFDNATVMVKYENGVRGTYMECHFSPFHDEDSEIGAIGNKGMGLAYIQQNKVVLKKKDPEEKHEITLPEKKGGHGGADYLIISDFLDCIEKGCTPESDVTAGWDSAVLGRLAQKSANNEGRLFSINPGEYKYEKK
ncbi:MAG: Gfo/Idh/MocA family protein [Halanaerobiaceae bacterium]